MSRQQYVDRLKAQHGEVDSRIAIAGHPIHAMLVAFPISGTFGTAFCDLAFWWTADPFWARTALWAVGAAFAMGVLAAIAGLAETILVPGVRRRAAAWSHATVAMMLLSVLGASWGLRLGDTVGAILPWGAFLSGISVILVALTGWHGGKLVFEHQVGVKGIEDSP